MTKDERRRAEARRRQVRIKRTKAVLIGSFAIVMPLLLFLVTQR